MGDGCEIRETVIHDQVPLAAHSAAYEGGRDPVEILDLVAESVARGLVPGPVLPEGVQVDVAEVVLHRDGVLLHDVGDLRLGVGGLGELETRTVYIVPERHDVDTLPVLGDTVVLAVQDLVQRGVPHVPQGVDDDIEGPPFIVDGESLDVLAEYHLGSVVVAYPDHVEEQGSAGHALVIIVESLLPAGDGECLTGETSETDVESGDVPLVYLGYIAVDLVGGVEVRSVCLLGVGVPFAGEHGLDPASERSVESHADPAYPREQVYGSELGCHLPFTASSILSAQSERFFLISFPQNLRTIQSWSANIWFTSKSLWILRSILFIQNSLLVLMVSLRFSQSYPCQNSLSQNTATFFPMNAMSGLPGTVFTFLRYLSPRDQSSFLSITSIFVSLQRIRDML